MKSYHQKGPSEIIYPDISLRFLLSSLPQRDSLLVKPRGAHGQMTSENDDLPDVEHVSFLQDSSEVLLGGALDTLPEIN